MTMEAGCTPEGRRRSAFALDAPILASSRTGFSKDTRDVLCRIRETECKIIRPSGARDDETDQAVTNASAYPVVFMVRLGRRPEASWPWRNSRLR